MAEGEGRSPASTSTASGADLYGKERGGGSRTPLSANSLPFHMRKVREGVDPPPTLPPLVVEHLPIQAWSGATRFSCGIVQSTRAASDGVRDRKHAAAIETFGANTGFRGC